jgi:ATPase subunit of ABC transporter with duplicated ATPase domains
VLGCSAKLGDFARHAMDLLNGDQTVFETLDAAFSHAGQGSLRTLAGAFGFSGDEVENPYRLLDGG